MFLSGITTSLRSLQDLEALSALLFAQHQQQLVAQLCMMQQPCSNLSALDEPEDAPPMRISVISFPGPNITPDLCVSRRCAFQTLCNLLFLGEHGSVSASPCCPALCLPVLCSPGSLQGCTASTALAAHPSVLQVCCGNGNSFSPALWGGS